ncbi:hypothetical protein RYX36_014708, partial [Vicia faba]
SNSRVFKASSSVLVVSSPSNRTLLRYSHTLSRACNPNIKVELNSIKDAFDCVAKKQKLCSSKSQETVDQSKLSAIKSLQQLEGPHKELNSSLAKYQKILEKSLNTDISKAYRNVQFDTYIINQIIASHLYRLGLFDLGDNFIKEAGEPNATSLRSQFLEMHQVIEAMRGRNLQPALT